MRFSLLSAVILLSSWAGIVQADGTKVPDTLKGDWRVVSGQPDNLATIIVDTKVNDPRYVGRVVHFNNDSVSGEMDGSVSCQQPAYNQQSPMTLNEAILKTSGERHLPPKIPVAKDFGLKTSGHQKITPILLQCKTGYLGPDGVSMGNWVALLSADTLVMNWEDNSYFVLKHIKQGDKVTPSFSCNAKLNDAEKTICGNDDLAAWDRSVSDAFKVRLLQQRETDPKDAETMVDIKSAQRTWLGKRNQCQSDVACLKKIMKERVQALVEESQ